MRRERGPVAGSRHALADILDLVDHGATALLGLFDHTAEVDVIDVNQAILKGLTIRGSTAEALASARVRDGLPLRGEIELFGYIGISSAASASGGRRDTNATPGLRRVPCGRR